ncbi:DsbA family protein [Sulfitobacter sp. D35]|uniref:DsbA family protein n=1 Tax=Sulfitobacter sp. D35 TaxID=3083252 RepID=UPI00296FB6C7|nr:DsbA family protein [Sulfitobacter sp. D35]MDW4497665.1 DsbA family protein [Sulfitobacter sp. D35]
MLKRHLLPALIGAMSLGGAACALDLNAMTDEERAIFRQEVRDYLMENPEVIMEAVATLEERQAEERAAQDNTLVADNASALFDDGFSFVGGNPDGDITLVEFMDYRCGYCKRAYSEVEKLLETDGNIRFIVKEFPILGEQSVLASRFAVATKQVAGDSAYKQVHDALMAFNGDITLQALKRLAGTFDLDGDAIEQAMDDEAVTAEISATRELAQKLRISGTPTFVLEDEMLRGYLPYDQMQAIVTEKRDL